MADEKKVSPKKKAIQRVLALMVLLLVLGIAGLVGWLSTRSAFLAGSLVGLCVAFPLGLLAGIGLFAALLADDPEFQKKVTQP